jgi:starvation-inducible DNA-binding protein
MRQPKELQQIGDLWDMPIALDEKARKQSVLLLNTILADSMVLRDMYKKHHWQVVGDTFYSLHLLYDKHYQEQLELIDTLAERIQLLGGVAIAMAEDVVKYTKIKKIPSAREPAETQLTRLVEAHKTVLEQVRKAAKKTAQLGDDGTNDLLVSQVLRTNEFQAWFIVSHLQGNK